MRAANFLYYAPRCAHGSSLSPAIHALVAARLESWRWRNVTSGRRPRSTWRTTWATLRSASTLRRGGLWQAAVFGFAGLRLTDAGPELHPNLPPQWGRLSFRTCLRGREHELSAAAKVAPGSANPEIA